MVETLDLGNLGLGLLAFLFAIGLIAGLVDAIAGGGGLLALPALLFVGIPPISAIATNKLQGVFGAATAALTYWRKGHINVKKMRLAIATTFCASALGAVLVHYVDPQLLTALVPIALILIAVYFLLSPKLDDQHRPAKITTALFALTAAPLIGFYDGIFGPGTGSFFTIAFIMFLGLGMTSATANTKLLNATSNFAGLLVFAFAGDIVWKVGLTMALGQIIGGRLGALTGMRFGAKLIKPLLVVVSTSMAIRLLWKSHPEIFLWIL